MSTQKTRERIIDAVRKMRENTVGKGCTPAEAALFAAKAAEWIEKYQIDEAELRDAGGNDDTEVCQNFLRTGKKVFNPGMSEVVNSLAIGMCCKCIFLPHNHRDSNGSATYGIVGDQLDADYVCQIATMVVPALQVMANWVGKEHGYEKASLVRWSNQYLTGAGYEIKNRLERERQERSDAKLAEHQATGTALVCITGAVVAVAKREATNEAFDRLYPRVKTTHSRAEYNHTAQECGREAGKNIGLRLELD